jgi:hypothetical protein
MRDQSGPAITSLPVVVEENFNRPLTIEEARYILLNDDPYFAYLLQNCTLKWDERAKTAFVTITPKAELLLVICKSFWDTLPGLHRVGLLIHEMFHLLNEHDFFPTKKRLGLRKISALINTSNQLGFLMGLGFQKFCNFQKTFLLKHIIISLMSIPTKQMRLTLSIIIKCLA